MVIFFWVKLLYKRFEVVKNVVFFIRKIYTYYNYIER